VKAFFIGFSLDQAAHAAMGNAPGGRVPPARGKGGSISPKTMAIRSPEALDIDSLFRVRGCAIISQIELNERK
jgi:hypothetical protein